ncbi:CIR protein PIR protein [Plasmodium vinckei brucechwatti]|uniref:CIR protein PIR protein n=1 Tax=Plasmodium vinckei brucechwatti TaxID=119398 RepID=A0A6V7RZV1_PLAVN|nr:CIR protein PIR protein [Plasmodium vinckei brucechwatti]
MSRHVCEMLNSLYSQLPDDDNEGNQINGGKLLYETYCPTSKERYQKCNSDHDKIKAGFIYLVFQLFGNVNSEGEHEDQKKYYVYYGFLWMSYKLQQSNITSDQHIGLYDFLNNHIVNDDWYDIIGEHVEPKMSLLNKETDIGLMSEIYYILKEMCKQFSKKDDSFDYLKYFSKYYNSVKKFGENILKKSKNGNIDNIDKIYVDLYDMLKNDYNEYRKDHYGKNSHSNPPPELPNIKEIQKKITHDLKTSDSQDRANVSLESQDGDENSKQQQPVQQPHQTPDLHIPGGALAPSDSGSKGTGYIKDPQENKQGAAGGEQKDSGGSGGESNGDQGSQGGSDSAPGASRSQIASWLSFDIGSSILGIASKGMEQLNNALDFFEEKKEQLTKVTDTIKDLYSTSVSNIKTVYDNSRNFLNSIIDNISNQPEKVDMPSTLGGSQPGSNGTGSGLPTTNDPTPPQKDSPQTPPGTPHTSLPSPDPKDQPNVHQLPQGSPGSQISNQKDQGGSQKPVPVPVTKPENSVTKVKVNETTGIGDIYVLKEYKQIGISIIVLLIPIVLDIMYKYLYYGCGKKSKRKKNMKKVINSIGGKRQVQIIISSSSHKKQTKKSINSFNEKKSLLNIYKLMQADPIPFINLFFLLIFFVYKRKRDTIE